MKTILWLTPRLVFLKRHPSLTPESRLLAKLKRRSRRKSQRHPKSALKLTFLKGRMKRFSPQKMIKLTPTAIRRPIPKLTTKGILGLLAIKEVKTIKSNSRMRYSLATQSVSSLNKWRKRRIPNKTLMMMFSFSKNNTNSSCLDKQLSQVNLLGLEQRSKHSMTSLQTPILNNLAAVKISIV